MFMKIKQKYGKALILSLALATINLTANAQSTPKSLPEHGTNQDAPGNYETLSGINLQPAAKGTFLLDFNQELKENAVLEVKNKAGQLVYQKPVSISSNKQAGRYNLGKLQPDTYLIEVKTSDTTYWTRFKVGR
jgi:hypothetical protein